MLVKTIWIPSWGLTACRDGVASRSNCPGQSRCEELEGKELEGYRELRGIKDATKKAKLITISTKPVCAKIIFQRFRLSATYKSSSTLERIEKR